MNKMKKKEIIITIILFILIFSMRLPYINNSPAEQVDMWRQADTESIARNFLNHNFNILYPQLNYDGPLPNYIQLELQITTYLIAILYKIFGQHIFLARLVPTMFFMISVFYLFKLMKDIYNVKLAWITISIYSILPISIFFSRAIMPESAELCFFNGAFYYFYKWYENDNRSDLFLSGIFTALAISQKTPAIFIGLAMIAICIDKYGLSFLKKIDLWIFGLISLVPPLAYIKWSGELAEFKFVSGIGAKHIIPKFTSALLTPEAITFYEEALPRTFTGLAIILALLGLLTLTKKKDRPILYLFIAIVLEVVFIVSVIKFRYYLIFLAPIIAILSGKILYIIFSKGKLGSIITILVLLTISYNSYNNVKDDFKLNKSVIEFAETVDAFTEERDLIVVGTLDPSRISMSNRQGWRANIGYYDHIPKGIEGEINYFRENGAKYFVVENNKIYNDDGSYLKYLDDNFEKAEINDIYKFYNIKK